MKPKTIVVGFIVAMFVGIGAMYAINPFHARTLDPRGRVTGRIPYRVASVSMEPTHRQGDLVFADVRQPQTWRRGDVIVFDGPEEHGGGIWLTRVIAVAGDRVAVQDDTVVLNGDPLVEPYADWSQPPGAHDSMDELVVPEGHVFTLGDNRGNSLDGRFWGPLAVERIVGTVARGGAAERGF